MTEALLESPTEAAAQQHTEYLSARLVLHLNELQFSDDELLRLSSLNSDLRLEQTAEGDLIIMPPTGGYTGNRNHELNRQLGNWTKADGRGAAFDSSTGFKLPNGAKRSPDAAWVLRERLSKLTVEQKTKFIPLCPDFVIELKSPTDRLEDIEAKMREYIANGASLGWLLNPETRRVSIYRPNVEVEIQDNVESINAESLLTNFALDLREIWQPNI